MIRRGLDFAWDVASVIPVVGAGKGAWDVGWWLGTKLGDGLEQTFRYEEAFLADTVYDRYGTSELDPKQAADLSKRYEGVKGFLNFAWDAVT